MKKFFMWGSVLFILATLASCNDDDDTTPVGYGDAYIISRYAPVDEGEEPVLEYKLYIGASGMYGTLSSVHVTTAASSFPMTEDGTNYYYFESGYSMSKPDATTYTFQYIFESGETFTNSDVLTADVLEPATITSCAYANNAITVEWDAVTDADAYEIRLKESDGDLVFRSTTSSGYLVSSTTSYPISPSYGTWESGYSMKNETYTVEVVALEADNRGLIQSQAIATESVLWGSSN